MKHHLITGAASGFGFGLARTLLARGHSVMACDINTAPMEQLRAFAAAPAQLNIRQLDVRDPAQWEQTMQAAAQLWPRIDTVMNAKRRIKRVVPGAVVDTVVSEKPSSKAARRKVVRRNIA